MILHPPFFVLFTGCELPSSCKSGDTGECEFDAQNSGKGVKCTECVEGYFVTQEGLCQSVFLLTIITVVVRTRLDNKFFDSTPADPIS